MPAETGCARRNTVNLMLSLERRPSLGEAPHRFVGAPLEPALAPHWPVPNVISVTKYRALRPAGEGHPYRHQIDAPHQVIKAPIEPLIAPLRAVGI